MAKLDISKSGYGVEVLSYYIWETKNSIKIKNNKSI